MANKRLLLSMLVLLVIFVADLVMIQCDKPIDIKGPPNIQATRNWMVTKGEMDKIYQLIANMYKDQSQEDLSQDPSLFTMNKKYDDVGHLRFGKRNNRLKYNDPDYGHMRFGK